MRTCRQTARILAAWMDAGRLDDRGARHVSSCRWCTDALARADAIDRELRAAIRPLVAEPAAAALAGSAPAWRPPDRAPGGAVRAGATMRGRTGLVSLLGSLVGVLVLVVAGIRLSSTPAAPPGPVLPVALEPAEAALHRSGLRCVPIGSDVECGRQLTDGWRQVVRLEVADGDVQRVEVELVAGTAVLPVERVSAGLSGPAEQVLGVPLAEAVDGAVAADGIACGCTRTVLDGTLRVDGDPDAGYLLVIEGGGPPH